jgi:hypothetical protein
MVPVAPTEEMNPVALRRALNASEIRVRLLEQELKRRSSSRFSGISSSSDADSSHARAKLEKPSLFEGEYTELYNILNWLHTAERYLARCRVAEGDYLSYVRSYCSATVQAWMDGTFLGTDGSEPTWKEVRAAMIERYLPVDHRIRLELVFQRTVQRTNLVEYVERFNVLDSALSFAQVRIEDQRKVLQFISGIKRLEERRFILDKSPSTLKEVYAAVVTLRQSKVLSSTLVNEGEGIRYGSPSKSRTLRKLRHTQRKLHTLQSQVELLALGTESKELHKLQGVAKDKAWAEGACLECGEKGHLIRDCPKLRKDVQRTVRRYTREFLKKTSTDSKKRSKKRFNKLDSQDEDKGAKADTGSDESDLSTESSEESQSESSGNSDLESRG